MQETESNRLRDIFRAAADLVEQGWCQRKYATKIDGQQCYCIDGAVAMAESGDPHSVITPECTTALNMLAWEKGFSAITDYNDEPGRTQAEVVAVLRDLAETVGGTIDA